MHLTHFIFLPIHHKQCDINAVHRPRSSFSCNMDGWMAFQAESAFSTRRVQNWDETTSLSQPQFRSDPRGTFYTGCVTRCACAQVTLCDVNATTQSLLTSGSKRQFHTAASRRATRHHVVSSLICATQDVNVKHISDTNSFTQNQLTHRVDPGRRPQDPDPQEILLRHTL